MIFAFIKDSMKSSLLRHLGPTHGNIWVYIPDARVLYVGDTLTTSIPPILCDGQSELWLQSLAKLKQWQQKVDVIVPGRGAIGDVTHIDAQCDYLELMRTRMHDLIATERPFAETAVYISEFLERYPNHNLPISWVRQRIHHTLNQIYHEIKFAKDGIVMGIEKEF